MKGNERENIGQGLFVKYLSLFTVFPFDEDSYIFHIVVFLEHPGGKHLDCSFHRSSDEIYTVKVKRNKSLKSSWL